MPTHLVIFDARSLYDPGWHASRNRDDLNEVGSARCANGLVAGMLVNVLDRMVPRPTHLFVAWDGPVGKSNKPRGPKPPGFHNDKREFAAWWKLSMAGTHFTALPGTEADDLCASAAIKSVYDHTTVVSADKDLHQLVSDKVRLYNPSKKCYVTKEDVLLRWGVDKPSHVALALALIGDKGDGIDGVPGIGPKKAARCLAPHTGRSFIQIYDALAADHGKPFTESFEMVLLNRDLEVEEPTPIVLKHARSYLSPDGEVAWNRLVTKWSRPPLDDDTAHMGLVEEG